jgi:two-component system, OmpR family, sensor histidine kinase TctE
LSGVKLAHSFATLMPVRLAPFGLRRAANPPYGKALWSVRLSSVFLILALSTKQIDPALLVRQVAADLAPLLIAADRDVEVVVEDAKSICGDAGAIERAITNLVQNAIQHGGRQLILRVLHSTIEVEDDGPGIPPDERERVFEPFHRVRPRPSGSGLGLNLVQQVVDRHGGSVSIAEARDGGTIVRMVFPPAEA